MLSLPVGPLALPLPPLLLALGLAVALLVLRLLTPRAPRAQREALAGALWLALALGLLTARLLYVLRHADAYANNPLLALDVRDGGWLAGAGVTAALVLLLLRAAGRPAWRKPLALSAAAGLLVWLAAGEAVLLRQSRQAQLPALTLSPLATDAPASLPALLDGRPLVVNLWASWCGPCRAEMPVFAAAQQRERGVRFVFVNQGESAAVVQAWLAREGLALQDVYLDLPAALAPAVGSAALPTTLFVNARGQRIGAHVGALNEAALRVRLQQLQAP